MPPHAICFGLPELLLFHSVLYSSLTPYGAGKDGKPEVIYKKWDKRKGTTPSPVDPATVLDVPPPLK